MGTVLEFKPIESASRRQRSGTDVPASIVIFPGVRIERHASDLDLGHRVRKSAGRENFNGLGRKPRPRKTS